MGVVLLRVAVTVETVVLLNAVTFTPIQTVPPALGVVSDTVGLLTFGFMTSGRGVPVTSTLSIRQNSAPVLEMQRKMRAMLGLLEKVPGSVVLTREYTLAPVTFMTTVMALPFQASADRNSPASRPTVLRAKLSEIF